MNDSVSQLIALIAIVGGLAIAYGRSFGQYQSQIVQWVIDAGRVASRYRGLTNLAVGVVIATAFTVIGAAAIGRWDVVPVGVLAGVFASVEAAKVHDAGQSTDTPPTT